MFGSASRGVSEGRVFRRILKIGVRQNAEVTASRNAFSLPFRRQQPIVSLAQLNRELLHCNDCDQGDADSPQLSGEIVFDPPLPSRRQNEASGRTRQLLWKFAANQRRLL